MVAGTCVLALTLIRITRVPNYLTVPASYSLGTHIKFITLQDDELVYSLHSVSRLLNTTPLRESFLNLVTCK